MYDSQGFLKRIVNAYNSEGASNTYWEARKADARGNVIEERAGNGLITQRFFSGKTGHLKGIKTYSLLAPSQPVQDLQYVYDKLGNLKERKDFSYNGSTKKNVLESFDYDNMNRLETSTIGNDVQTVTYMKNGNIKTKTGLDTYIYGAATVSDTGVVRSNAQQNAGPHAVSEAKGVKYTYDNNGNMTTDTSGRSIKYTAFDKAYEMKKGSDTVLFSYDTGRSRYKRVDKKTTNSNTTTTTTYYVGNVEYVEKSNGSVDVKRNVGGRLIEVNSFYANGNKVANSQTLAYLFKDRLGSLHKQIDANGELIEELDFNAWGQRRHAQDPKQLLAKYQQGYTAETKITVRGFTGHEMVDSLGLIHMNGRIYDAALGRFLQADPIVQAPNSAQSHNRYSYGFNNPMGGVDPSGYSFRQYIGVVVAVVLTVWAPWGSGVWASFAYGAIAGDIQATVNGAGAFDRFVAGVSSGAFAAVGSHFTNGFSEAISADQLFNATVSFGAIGGITSVLQGGKFGHGFVSAGLGTLAGQIPGLSGKGNLRAFGRTAVAVVVGGTSSRISGGKFANGAAGAAFSAAVGAIANSARTPATPQRTLGSPIQGDVVGPIANIDVGSDLEITLVTDGELVATAPSESVGRFDPAGPIEEVIVRRGCSGGACNVPQASSGTTTGAEFFVASRLAGADKAALYGIVYPATFVATGFAGRAFAAANPETQAAIFGTLRVSFKFARMVSEGIPGGLGNAIPKYDPSPLPQLAKPRPAYIRPE